jgi:ferredoxin
LKIHIDHDRCLGAGQCVMNAPELFDQSDDDGTVVLLDEQPPPELHAAARRAADLCPNAVISILDPKPGN